jgi:hypothetical protein
MANMIGFQQSTSNINNFWNKLGTNKSAFSIKFNTESAVVPATETLTSCIRVDMHGGEMDPCNVIGKRIDPATIRLERKFDTFFPLVFAVETCKGVITINHLLTCALDILDGVAIEQLLNETEFKLVSNHIICHENLHLTVIGTCE